MHKIIFDGSSYFLESVAYELGEGEEVIKTGSNFSQMSDYVDQLNEEANG